MHNNEDKCIAELVAKVFTPQYSEFENYTSVIRLSDPTFEPKNVRLLEIDGKIVSHVHILPRMIQVGSVMLRCGGIGCVATPQEYQGHGYNKLLMEHCVQFMAAEGYDISLLDGIPNYYHKFGYEKVMPKYTWALELSAVESLKRKHKIRKVIEADCRYLNQIYLKEFKAKSGIVVRTNDMWWSYLRLIHGDLWVVVNSEEIPEGYIWFDRKNKQRVLEAGALNTTVSTSILSFLAEKGKDHYQAEIEGDLFPNQRFVQFTTGLFGGRFEIKFEKSGGWMGRICNLQSTLNKIVPELKKRLQCSQFACWNGSLTFATDLGDVTIGIENSEFRITDRISNSHMTIKIPQSALLQLVFGFHDIQELVFAGVIECDESTRQLFKVLFPKQRPVMSRIDWF